MPIKDFLGKEKTGDFSPFILEMRSRHSLLLSGVRRVLLSTGENVRLVTDAGERFEVGGKGLRCAVFSDRTVEIVGEVRTIGIGGEDEKED